MDFNAGVYLSAVKPVLEKIAEGWQLELNNTMIVCREVFNRNDISGRKVCTKLVMFLTENLHPAVRTKVVLHFYHTSNALQIQDSHVMSTGDISPVWLAVNLLQPLAAAHSSEQTSTINAINANIQQSRTFSCRSCNLAIDPAAANPKDQEVSCCKCKNLFHKKCTDRRKSTANWRKTPWYCSACIAGSQDRSEQSGNPSLDSKGPSQSHFISDVSSRFNIAATPFTPRPDVFPATQSVQHQAQSQGITTPRVSTEPVRPSAPIDDVAVVEEPGPAPSNQSVEKAAGTRFRGTQDKELQT
jgi:hypothetical protein